MSSYTIRVIMGVETTVTAGAPGRGVPPGGTTGQVLAKASGGSFDTEWVDPSGPGGPGDVVGPASSVDGRMAVFDGATGKLLKQGTKTGAEVAAHVDSTSNPHGTTAAQVGADPAGTAFTAVAAHVGAADPHGDRAYADAGDSALAASVSSALATKLDDLAAGTEAEIVGANSAGTALQRLGYSITSLLAAARDRATHTGTQLAATISDFATQVVALLSWANITGKPSTFPPSSHTHPASEVSDSTAAGRALLTAADEPAQRTALGLGDAATKNVGTGSGAVAAGDHNHTGVYAPASHTHALADLTQSGASSGQVATWNGTAWVPQTPSGGGGSPGGSGSELQYRSGASTFGGAAGTHWDAVNGRLSIGAGTSPAGMVHTQSSAASVIAAVLQAAASQTGNLLEFRDSAAAVLAAINSGGLLLAPAGSASAPSLSFLGDPDTGIYNTANAIRFATGGTLRATLDNNGLLMASALTGNGTVGFYGFRHSIDTRTVTGGITTGRNFQFFDNTGASSRVDETLPTAVAGNVYGFYCGSSAGWRITANTGDTIRIRDVVTAAAGYIESTTVGSIILLIAMDATQYVAFQVGGVWTNGTWTYDDTGLTT